MLVALGAASRHGGQFLALFHPRKTRCRYDPCVELKRLEDFDAEDPGGSSALPGATALLAALPERSWAIVTSAPARLAKTRLQDLCE
jgi:beta-phosphoglucomutase-like phosphatase (HAD superfamily)